MLVQGEEILLLGRNKPCVVTSSRCTGGEKSSGAFVESPRECPVPHVLVLRAAPTPVWISQSSFGDAFESCPCVQCTLCLLIVGLSKNEEDEPPVPVIKKAEEFFHPQAQKFMC